MMLHRSIAARIVCALLVSLALGGPLGSAAVVAAPPAKASTARSPGRGTTAKPAAKATRVDPSEAVYVALKKEFDELRDDAEKRRFRHNYEALLGKLEAAAKKHRGAGRGDDCAFLAAQLHAELYAVSRLSVDRNAAVDSYADVAAKFPSSNLRDDALIAAARLTTDVVRGRGFVDAVIAMKGSEFRDVAKALKAERFPDAVVAEAKKQAATKKLAQAEAKKAADDDERAMRIEDERRDEEHFEPADAVAPGATVPATPAPALTTPSMASAFARLQGPAAATTTTTAPFPTTTTTTTTTTAPVAMTGSGAVAAAGPAPAATGGPAAATGAERDAAASDAEDVRMRLERSDAARVAMKPVAVLPDRPPLGTPARKVMVIRHDHDGGESVVRLRISGDVGILRGDVPASGDVGRRIFYDVAPARLGQRNIQPIEVHDGTIARVRAGQYETDVVRLVVELEGKAEPVLSVTRKPFELVLTSPSTPRGDVVAGVAPRRPAPPPPDATEVKERIGAGIGTPGAPGGVSISQQLGLKVHRVVIDAGHGGHDTGAIGPGGVREKDITLQIAQRIRDKLNTELPSVEVIMTRDDDRTLALQDRTNTSNAAAADLFISIHCNASPSRRVRGVETYYLNITNDKYEMKLAARENAELGEGSISDLDFILADLAMKSNVDDSVRLGRAVQKNIMTKLHKTWPDVPDLGLKHALFYVLMGNKMPSILVETSFLSNRQEEKRLASPGYQDAIADGVVDGVRAFVDERQAFFATP
jgi:N-acetylmuramoyl-L-alanine amidase